MFYFVALPGVGLCMLNVYLTLPPGGEHEQVPFVPYEHLRLRNKVGF